MIGGRYRVVRELGRGGMAVVYEVIDTVRERRLALKLLTTKETASDARLLFQKEYHGLSHLAHPCIVRVFDYDSEPDEGAFYTMELLAGGDLRALAPLPARRVCMLLWDVCSALSLLHSRRLVHRDLTPRNIRCTDAGTAKLIDFGAVMPFGPCWRMVGTPPYCAPEMLDGEELDGRADLFSLGATAYFALTGYHAYPASGFAVLRELWSEQPPLIQELADGIPDALAELVHALIEPNRMRRPTTAAEVMERLAAIGGLETTERGVVPQSYLITPALVGRDVAMSKVRRRVDNGLRGRGGAVLISGQPGVGRTRFLSACVLEAKLQGAVVARAHSEGPQEPFSGARQWVAHLLEYYPGLLGRLSLSEQKLVLRWYGDGDGERRRQDEIETGDALGRFRLQRTLLQLFFMAAEERGLVVAVDDLQRLDEPTVALCALLVHSAKDHALVVIGTVSDGHREALAPALRMIQKGALPIVLDALSADDVALLLRSIFGEMAHLREVAQHLWRVSGGAPGPLMRLAQHLVDQSVVVYRAGLWVLAGELDPAQLPSSLLEALSSTVQGLSGAALTLAQTLALVPQDALLLQELLLVATPNYDGAQVLAGLYQLVRLNVVRVDGEHYALYHAGLLGPLLATLQGQAREQLHGRLVGVFEQRRLSFFVVDQLYASGAREQAVDRLISMTKEDLIGVRAQAVDGVRRELPHGWSSRLQELLQYCREQGRPYIDCYILRAMIIATQILLRGDIPAGPIEELLDRLSRDCGLDIYAALEDMEPGVERLHRALALAQERYELTPVHEQVASPREAIPWLARTILQVVGLKGAALDRPFFDQVPSLAPLLPLSPALAVVEWNLQATRELASGCVTRAVELYQRTLDRLLESDKAGLDELHHRQVVFAVRYALECMRVAKGGMPNPEVIAELREEPLFEVSACGLEQVHALRTADLEAALRFEKQADLLRLQSQVSQMFDGSLALIACDAYVLAGDLAHLKQVLAGVRNTVRRHRHWWPILLWGEGQYKCLCGDPAEGLVAFEQAETLAPAGTHMAHPMIIAARISCLVQLGRVEDAVAVAERYLSSSVAKETSAVGYRVQLAAALALVAAGQPERALGFADEGLALLEAMEAGGTVLGFGHEVRARVACAMGDGRGFHAHTLRCRALYRAGEAPMLTARYGRLLAAGHVLSGPGSLLTDERELSSTVGESSSSGSHARRMSVSSFTDPQRRAQAALEEVVDVCGALGGFMYLVQARGPELVAQCGGYPPPAELERRTAAYLSAAMSAVGAETTCTTQTAQVDPPVWVALDGGRYYPVVLAHEGPHGLEFTALVAIRSASASCVVPSLAVTRAISQALSGSDEATAVLRGRG